MKTTARAPQAVTPTPATHVAMAPALQDQHELGNQAVLGQALGAQGDQGFDLGLDVGIDMAPLDMNAALNRFEEEDHGHEHPSVEVELLGNSYAFHVVERDEERDAHHVTQEELGRVRRVFTSLAREVKRLEGGEVHPSLRKGLRFGDFADTAQGRQTLGLVTGKAAEQARKAADRMAVECTRSAAYREILHELVEGDGAPVEMLFGEHSCGFFDSYASGAVDIDDFDCLQEADRPFQGEQFADGTGMSKGELLMHVLEERLHMVRSDGYDYERAHYAAMADGSFQNRYREERGLQGRTVDLDCSGGCDHHHQDFVTMDDVGNRTIVRDVPTSKSNVADLGWTPNQADIAHERVDTAQVAAGKLEQVVHLLAAEPRVDDRKLASLQHWAGVGQAQPDTAVAAAEQRLASLQERFKAEAKAFDALKGLDKEQAKQGRELAKLEAQVQGVDASELSEEVPTLDLPSGLSPEVWADFQQGTGSSNPLTQSKLEKHERAVAALRSPKAAHEEAVARIERLKELLASHDERVQEQVTVLQRHAEGPLLLPSAPNAWSDSAGYADARKRHAEGIARYKTALAKAAQNEAPTNDGSRFLVERRAERPSGINDADRVRGGDRDKGRRNCSFASLGAVLGCTASEAVERAQQLARAPVDRSQQTEESWWRMQNPDQELTADRSALGDAQWSGLQAVLTDEGKDLRTLKVQGAPDRGQTLSEDKLIDTLRKLGDGTQAVVWLTDADFTSGHYVYAEVTNGSVVFEDHQFAQYSVRDGMREATATVEELPQGALDHAIGRYTQGCFLALSAPKTA